MIINRILRFLGFSFSAFASIKTSIKASKACRRTAIWRTHFFILFYSCFTLSVQADFILSAPPRELPDAGSKLYGPLASHLTELLGEKVTYRHPNNWLEYQRDLRRGVYDIVFDGPHFVSWRVEHLHHDVLVKLPGSLEFVVAVYEDTAEINGIQDLIGKKVCAIPPPNLATLTMMEQFKNPVRQPVIWDVPGGFMNVYKALQRRECLAAVFRSDFYDKHLSGNNRVGLKAIFRSKPLPNQAISAGPRLNTDKKSKIIRSLTVGEGKNAALSISKRFAGNQAFVEANKEEYLAHNYLLEGVVFGW
jgi:ABC-type phosphate/phosphonate transport system substrate-binding protein